MAKSKDEYVVTNIVKGEGYTGIVHRPILTDKERALRYSIIEDALTDYAIEISKGAKNGKQQKTIAG